MPVVAWVTVIISGLIILAAAVGLLRVVLHLVAVHRTLTALAGGVAVIAEQTSTVPAVLPSVNSTLMPVHDFCESI
ncbi:hypothetical protein [Candidatus Poriferisodalis sp.]|uniref:hypothetical protein n=1 Tax=Candidatus Poriferisodalis sp. TaxID=3101277 RepID=UPI003B01C745